ncbi:hypothetical protein ACOJCM_08055 [Billgrantia sp. LNSP4103-1]|uniref:hypothetical protein n=1 Tax=Billgrantia sp. LNSP4103-1 TaxID=3410266 RepID=UPI00403F972A
MGKPLRFVNALYARAQRDPTIKLHIVTALSLLAPAGSSSLERRFLGPFVERLYGDIPELAYARDAQANRLPDNVTVSEFFFQAGNLKNNTDQQRRYICTNYTHALHDLMAQGINVIGQLVAPDERGEMVSLSCNPDLTLDLIPRLRAQPYATACVAETNQHLPYMGNDAAVARTELDLLLDNPGTDYPLFSAPPDSHLVGRSPDRLLCQLFDEGCRYAANRHWFPGGGAGAQHPVAPAGQCPLASDLRGPAGGRDRASGAM